MKHSLLENLNNLQAEPSSSAAAEAKRRGLKYAGFGRYEDPRTNQITHVVLNGNLTPYNRAVKTNQFRNTQSDDLGTYSQLLTPQLDEMHNRLVKAYPPERYDDQELNALNAFTAGEHATINSRLANMPAGVPVTKIEPQSLDDPYPDMIASLDSATKKGRAPAPFLSYTKMHPDFDPSSLAVGATFRFKGFRTTSLNPVAVIGSSENSRTEPSTGRNSVILLQMNIPKNVKGIYASDYSASPQDYEFIMHRGAQVQVASEFKKLVGSDALSNQLNLEIYYADCVVK
jgi:ADP-ribosyltransferase exoenzyme